MCGLLARCAVNSRLNGLRLLWVGCVVAWQLVDHARADACRQALILTAQVIMRSGFHVHNRSELKVSGLALVLWACTMGLKLELRACELLQACQEGKPGQ
jgi:hypothetical protein